MFEDNGILKLNPSVQGTIVVDLDTNLIQKGPPDGTFVDGTVETSATFLMAAGSQPMTFVESSPNSGVFLNYDELDDSDLDVTSDAPYGYSASIDYNKHVTSIVVSSEIILVSVSTDKLLYNYGDTVLISGSVSPVIEGVPVNIQIKKSDGTLVTIDQFNPESDGIYSREYQASGPLWNIIGSYTVVAQYDQEEAQIIFFFRGNVEKFCGKSIDQFKHVMSGTEKNDLLVGTDSSDLILGKEGSDIILGKGGNDCIYGGRGSDIIFGYSGNDRIVGNEGDDYINGGDGDDRIFGNSGNDVIDGEADTDVCNGGVGTNRIANCEL